MLRREDAASALLTSGDCTAFAIAEFNSRTMLRGVAAGAASEVNETDSNPGTPDSTTVGTSGAAPERCELASASAFSFPARMCGRFGSRPSKASCTWPERRSVRACVLPL